MRTIKTVPTIVLQHAYRGLVRLHDKRLSSGSRHRLGNHISCACVLVIAAVNVEHPEALTDEQFQTVVANTSWMHTFRKLGVDQHACDPLWQYNDDFKAAPGAPFEGSNDERHQRARYDYMLRKIKTELVRRGKLPVPATA